MISQAGSAKPPADKPRHRRAMPPANAAAQDPTLHDLIQQMAAYERMYLPFDIQAMETFRFPDDLTPQEKARNLRADGRKHQRLMEYAQLANAGSGGRRKRIWSTTKSNKVRMNSSAMASGSSRFRRVRLSSTALRPWNTTSTTERTTSSTICTPRRSAASSASRPTARGTVLRGIQRRRRGGGTGLGQRRRETDVCVTGSRTGTHSLSCG